MFTGFKHAFVLSQGGKKKYTFLLFTFINYINYILILYNNT